MFFFFFCFSCFILFLQKESILMILLCFELLFFSVFIIFMWSWGTMGLSHMVMIVATFAVAEAAVGLGLLVGLVHISGSEGAGLILQVSL